MNNNARRFFMEYKRRNTAKNGRANGSGGFGTALFVVLSIILIAGIIVLSPVGEYLFGKPIDDLISCDGKKSSDKEIVSALKSQEEKAETETPFPTPTENTTKVVSVEEIPFYILQMGAFTSKSDAQEHADEIRQFGAGGFVYTEGSVYRVFAAAYQDESSLMSVQSQVRSDGFEATPYITEKKGFKLTLRGDLKSVETVKSASALLGEIPKELCDLALSFDKGELDWGGVTEKLNGLSNRCGELITTAEAIQSTDIAPIIELLKKYRENLSTFITEHDTIDEEILSGNLKYLQLSLIIDYILFFDQD